MIVSPAVDVRNGRCVQLVGGDPEREAVTLEDPVATAKQWRTQGFSTLHLVDLDAALGDGENSDVIERILAEAPGDAQVGGGIRSAADIERWLERGAQRVIVGTTAVEDPEWAARQAHAAPDRIIVAADVRDGRVLRRGWKETSDWLVHDFLEVLATAPFAGVLITDVSREGQLDGIDEPWIRSVVEAHPLRLWMSGGVSTGADVRTLADIGVHGVVIGMALYTGQIDATQVADYLTGGSR